MSTNYWQLLKDPRWQKMRLQVLERDGWTCQNCGDRERTLHVHHTRYERGLKPWEHDVETLKTLCEFCHTQVTERTREIQQVLGAMSPGQLAVVLGFVRGETAQSDVSYFSGVTHIEASSVDEWIGIATAAGLVHGFANRVVRRGITEGRLSLDWVVDQYMQQTDVLKEHFQSTGAYPLPSLQTPYTE